MAHYYLPLRCQSRKHLPEEILNADDPTTKHRIELRADGTLTTVAYPKGQLHKAKAYILHDDGSPVFVTQLPLTSDMRMMTGKEGIFVKLTANNTTLHLIDNTGAVLPYDGATMQTVEFKTVAYRMDMRDGNKAGTRVGTNHKVKLRHLFGDNDPSKLVSDIVGLLTGLNCKGNKGKVPQEDDEEEEIDIAAAYAAQQAAKSAKQQAAKGAKQQGVVVSSMLGGLSGGPTVCASVENLVVYPPPPQPVLQSVLDALQEGLDNIKIKTMDELRDFCLEFRNRPYVAREFARYLQPKYAPCS